MHDNPTLLSIDKAAAQLGVSASFLNKGRRNGTGPIYFKVAGKIGYAPADLDAWLSAQRRRSLASLASGSASQVSQ